MTAERDAVYRDARAAAMADYDELEPILEGLKKRATQLKLLIRATSLLIGEPADDKYEFFTPGQIAARGATPLPPMRHKR